MEVSFRANFITKTQVLKRGKISKKYSPSEVNFVKCNLTSNNDIKTLKDLKSLWPYSMASDIYREGSDKNYSVEVYALTTQDKGYEKLNPKEIIGLVETSNRNPEFVNIEYIQTKPEYIQDEDQENPPYKHIGTAMLNLFKNFETTKAIKLTPIGSAITFYEKNGFKIDPHEEATLVWEKKFFQK